MVCLKLTPFIGDGNLKYIYIGLLVDMSLKLTPFIGDGNFILFPIARESMKFKTNPVYRGRKQSSPVKTPNFLTLLSLKLTPLLGDGN